MTWRAAIKTLVALALIFLQQPRMNIYLAEEAFSVLLVIAVLLILIFLTVIAFLLFWQAARFASLRLKGMVGWTTSVNERPLQAEQQPFIPSV